MTRRHSPQKTRGVKTVLTFGTFDNFHDGHAFFLRQARQYGDRLIAVVARDATVRVVKGRLPELHEDARRKEVEAQGIADEVVLGSRHDYFAVLKRFRPDVIYLGYDQKNFITDKLQVELEKRGMQSRIVRGRAYKPEEFKSSIRRKKR